jgi:glycosyltransferase involved in cell wall biosynthesis
LEPRKNHLRVLRAWEALRLKSPDPVALVFVGSPGWSNRPLLREMQKWQSSGELFHLSAVPEPELRKLYAAADIVVAPSVSEGFDLPSVEAIRCGAVLAASDIPVHRELLGEAALYFNPYSVDSISDALEKLLANDTLRHDLSQKALRQGQQFNRENVRGQWQQVFDHCLARRPAT